MTFHLSIRVPGFDAVVGNVEAAICPIEHPSTDQNMLWILWIDNDVVQRQVVTLANTRKPVPGVAAVVSVIDSASQRPEIDVVVVAGVGREGARVPTIRTEGQPVRLSVGRGAGGHS